MSPAGLAYRKTAPGAYSAAPPRQAKSAIMLIFATQYLTNSLRSL